MKEQSFLHRLFPHSEIKNIRLFYILTIFTNGWFINANWVFLALLFMNKVQLGLVDGVCFAIGSVVDLPSGALADLIGRKRTIIIARAIFSLSCLLFIFSNDLMSFAFANLLFFIGTSFYAGADGALLYDSLKKNGKEKDFIKVAARNELLTRLSIFGSAIIGAYFFTLNMRYPFVLLFIFSLFALITSFKLEEIRIDEKRKFNLRQFFQQQYDGLRILFGPKLKSYVPFFLIIFGIYIMYGWGILRAYIAIDYGFGGAEQSIIFGTLALIVGFLGLLLPRIVAKSSDYKSTLLFSVLFTVGFFMVGYFIENKIWGLAVLFVLSLAGGMVQVLSQKIVNDEVASNVRATTLSALSIVTKIPYALGAYFVGTYAESGNLTFFSKILFIICAGSILSSILIKKVFVHKNV